MIEIIHTASNNRNYDTNTENNHSSNRIITDRDSHNYLTIIMYNNSKRNNTINSTD